ncbi:MAG: 50S ribosomal protein bL37 [Planctomycetota bacterium]
MNRNKRRIKKANHGARPANSRRRKARNRAEKRNG